MYPALEDGEKIILNKLIYIISDPERGDIVIIQHPEKNYVKRIIGLPNETIEINDHTLFVNVQAIDSSFVDVLNERLTGIFGPILVTEVSYFVIGYNSTNS